MSVWGLVDVRQLGQGNTADIFEYGQDSVLKLYKAGFPEEAIAEEFFNSQLVFTHGIKTPRPISRIVDEDRHGIVFERVAGFSMLDAMRKQPFRFKPLAKTMARLHAELHEQDVMDGLRQQKAIMSYHINNAPILSDQEKAAIIRHLQELPDDHKICHMDFHPDNILLDHDYWIIDWMTGMVGNPSGDVARTIVILSYGEMPQGTPKLVRFIVNNLRHRIKKQYIAEYLRITGKKISEIDPWILPVAAARLVENTTNKEKEQLVAEIRRRMRLFS